MTYSLSLRPRALAEIEVARDRYKLVGHGESFLDEARHALRGYPSDATRFPIVYDSIHRALLRRYPIAVFCATSTTDGTRILDMYSHNNGIWISTVVGRLRRTSSSLRAT